MDVAVRHGTADLGTYRDAPNKPICALHADVAENLAGTPNGGYLRVCVAALITEGSQDRPARSPSAGRPAGPAAVYCDSRGCSSRAGDAPHLPRTGQAAGQTANTSQNIRARWPRSCYLICMISPNRGDFPRLRVQVSDTVIPHDQPFPGMRNRHPGPAACLAAQCGAGRPGPACSRRVAGRPGAGSPSVIEGAARQTRYPPLWAGTP
jgi:hypothetical protein